MTRVSRVRALSAACLLLAVVLVGALLAPASARPAGPHVSWGVKSYAPGTPLTVKGRVPGGRRAVLLQVDLPGGWHTIARARSTARGRFAISTAFDWYGRHRVRVTAPGRHAFTRATKVTVATPYTPRGSKSAHTDLHPFGRSGGPHFTFNPCRTVKYRVDTDEVGIGVLPLVAQAFAQITQATGVSFRYVGASHVIPWATDHTKVDRGTQIVVGWATAAEAPRLNGYYGFGGPFNSYYARNGRGQKVLLSRTAGAVLDSQVYANGTLSPSFQATGPTTGELLLHELGHVMGLDHVTPTDEIMNPQAATDPYADGLHHALYGAGDLAGLRQLGLAQGCVHRTR